MSEIPKKGIWTEGIPMPSAKTAFGCAEVNGKIYCIGGSAAVYTTGFLTSVDIFDIESGVWSSGAAMPTARSVFGCVALEGKIYCCGGYYNNNSLSVLEIYDTATDTWSTGAPMLIAVRHPCGLTWDGKIYMICGTHSTNISNVQVYDPETNSWESAESYPVSDCMPAGAAIDNLFYCMGGNTINGSWFFDNLCIYDAVDDSWTEGAPMLTRSSCCLVHASENKVYCLGGAGAATGNGAAYDLMQIYNTETDSWSYGAPIPAPRWMCNGVIYQNKMYCIGGDNNSGTATSQVDIYTFAYAVTLQHQDMDGNVLLPEQVEVVEPADDLTATAPAIPGYICTGYSADGGTVQNGAAATLTEVLADHVITFLYQKDDTDLGITDPDPDPTPGPGASECGCCCRPCVHIHGNGISVNNLHIHCCAKDTCIDLNTCGK